MNQHLKIDSAIGTDVGCVRTNNEDSYCDAATLGLWAVADGMGGHENGEWASAAITAALGELVPAADFDSTCAEIAEAIHRANAVIFDEASARGIQMGSTAIALYLKDRRFAIFWVGDSRAYLLRQGLLYQLSRDHTQVQEMIDRGLMQPEQAEGHPMGHVLARAVGVQATVEVDAIADLAEPGDVFLLCSDGLTGQVTDPEIAEALLAPSAQGALDRLIALALERGAPDNVTIAIVEVSETTLLSPATAGVLLS